ncbi:hypothetical protein EB796_015846 [Bugula neritina]|uniref:Uncharacterized protein n=1 Tax=Bugula neritina TaxID=10212 RepID=A0A7J7JHN0_BUGNE|nr:hypothetical protein EB796_015846 [Bugula neritina]
MSDNDLENLLSNFTTPKLTHSSSTHPRDSTSSNRVVLGSIQPDPHQLPAEPQAKQLVDTKLGEESKENAAFSAAQTAVADPSTEKTAAGEVVAGDLFEDIRELDENERWSDRNVVITQLDHRENILLVGDIIGTVIDGLSISE